MKINLSLVFNISFFFLVSTAKAQTPPAQNPAPKATPPPTSSVLTPTTYNLTYADALEKSRALKLSEDRQWLLLGHYKKSLFGSLNSQVKDPSFFLAENGAKDPKAELEKTLSMLWAAPNSKDLEQDPQCRFPARMYWLKKKLGLQGPAVSEDPLLKKCTMYLRYRSVVKADSLSFVFSSYYANSPGSAFGHTFFRINKKAGPDGRRSELLDHGVGYAAQVTVSNPLAYAFFGLVGVFQGVFSNLPYYYKVREYNDFESRDLWSYDLNLTPEEVDMVARHLWEVGNSYFDYYFFTQNCAFHMLTVLEAAAPRYHLIERMPIYVIPSDTIKAINDEPGLVTGVHFRPSIRSVFIERYKALSPHDQEVFRSYMKDFQLEHFAKESEDHRVQLLDTTLDYIDVVHPENMVDTNSEGAKIKNQVLRARASIPTTSPLFNPVLPELERPELGHRSTRIAAGYGSNYLNHKSVALEFRFALHDLLDSHLGYPQHSQLEFGNFAGHFDFEDNEARLDNFDFFRVTALNPWSLFLHKMSWRVNIGAMRFKEGACDSACLASGIGIGAGYSAYLDGSERLLGYALLEGQAYYDVHFRDKPMKLAAGPTLGVLLNLSDRLKWSAEGTYYTQMIKAQKEDPRFTTELRYHAHQDWNLGLRYQHELTHDESFVMAYRYF